MAYSHAKVDIIGRLGADPELNYVESGDAVLNVSVAVDGYRGTTWWRGDAWGKKAEEMNAAGLAKGDLVQMKGTPKVRGYEDKDGKARASAECSIESLAKVTVNVNPVAVGDDGDGC